MVRNASVLMIAVLFALGALAVGCEMAADQKLYQATDALRLGKLDKAIELSTELIHASNIQPQDKVRFMVGARTIRGAAYRDQGKYDKAAQDFAVAVKLNPEWSGLYDERARLYEKTGRPAEALADLEKANQLDPKGKPDRFETIKRLKKKLGIAQ